MKWNRLSIIVIAMLLAFACNKISDEQLFDDRGIPIGDSPPPRTSTGAAPATGIGIIPIPGTGIIPIPIATATAPPENATGFKAVAGSFSRNFDPLTEMIYKDPPDFEAAKVIVEKMKPLLTKILDMDEVESNAELIRRLTEVKASFERLCNQLEAGDLANIKAQIQNLPALWYPINWWLTTGQWPKKNP